MSEDMETLTRNPIHHSEDSRKNMLRIMSEVSNNPANVSPEQQEELALFLVSELSSHHIESSYLSERWKPEEPS